MKDTLKTLTLLEEHLSRIAEQGIYEIERDLVLERLRQLYSIVATSELLPDSPIDEPVMYGCPPVEYEPIVEDEPEVEEEIEEEPAEQEEEEEKTLIEEVADKWLSNILQTDKQESEEPEIEEVKEEVEEHATANAQDEELDHEVVMSLYDDDDEEEPVVVEEEEVKEEEPEATEFEEVPAEEELPELEEVPAEPETPELEDVPAEEELPELEEVPAVADAPQSVVLGDILGTEQITVADNLAEQVIDVATATTANLSLRQTIAINDKFILMRDLFGGNNDYYEMAIDRLDSFDNLDDAMLYIYDNFHWNPNCEGARLLMELLARKLI